MFRAVAREGLGGGLQPPQFMTDQLTLSQPGGGTLSPPSTTSPTGFSDLATALNGEPLSKKIVLSGSLFLIFMDLNPVFFSSNPEIFTSQPILNRSNF